MESAAASDSAPGSRDGASPSTQSYRPLNIRETIQEGDEGQILGATKWGHFVVLDMLWWGKSVEEFDQNSFRFRRPLNPQERTSDEICATNQKPAHFVEAQTTTSQSTTVPTVVVASSGAPESEPLAAPTLEWTVSKRPLNTAVAFILNGSGSALCGGRQFGTSFADTLVMEHNFALQSTTATLRAENEAQLRIIKAQRGECRVLHEDAEAHHRQMLTLTTDRDTWRATHEANVAEHARLMGELEQMKAERDGFQVKLQKICDHEWEHIDDSFDHEFGTEQVHSSVCEKCGATKPYESETFGDEAI